MQFYPSDFAKILLPCFIGLFNSFAHAAAESGALIYQQGKTQSGQVLIGDDAEGDQGNRAPSVLFPCINCHGERAKGKQETGVVSPNITWSQLTWPYRRDLNGGTSRLPYQLESFKTVLIDGINSDGNQLSDKMPRYILSDTEITSLVSYLKVVALINPDGVTDSEIEISLLLPENPQLAGALRETVAVFVTRLNNQGGIFRRKLKITESAQTDTTPFCVMDLRMNKASDSIDDIVTLSIFSGPGMSQNGYALYPHPSDYDQLKVSSITKKEWHPMLVENQSPDQLLGSLRQQDQATVGSTALIHKPGDIELKLLFEVLQAVRVPPIILTDSHAVMAAGGQNVSEYPGDIFILRPPGPESVSRDGQRELTALANLSAAPLAFGKNLSMRLWTLALMKLLTSSLQQAGHDLTPNTFSNALQSQVDLDTGFGPSLSFSPGRRIGNSDMILQKIN